ncbi:MAG TPA: pseudouridine synthase [Corynebacterium sp.]|nr:pseudouridine synthase [Corynebacterium sp.]
MTERADGRPPARAGITATRTVLHGKVPEGEYYAARAGDSPYLPGTLLTAGTALPRPVPAWTFPELPEEPVIPFDYEVLHLDEQLIVIDKPHFLPTTSNGRIVRETVQTRLRREFGEEVTPLHRLDRLTAGVVVCSRRRETRGAYQSLFQERAVGRRYVAHTTAPLAEPRWREIAVPMRKDPGGREVRVDPRGTRTLTRLRGTGTRVELEPVTGHTHQLRVLLNHLGAPIIGDDVYPRDRGLALYDFRVPLQLLATEVWFVDPLNGREHTFISSRSLNGNVGEISVN